MVVGEHMGEERSPERIPQKYVNIITIVMRVFITKVHASPLTDFYQDYTSLLLVHTGPDLPTLGLQAI